MSLKSLAARSKAAMDRVDQAESSTLLPARAERTPVSNAGAMMMMQPQITAAEKRAELAESKLGGALLVPLDALVSVPGRRRKLTDEQFEQLRDNLANNPLIQPIVVKRVDDERFEVISGDNRLAAYKALGRKEIEVTISSSLDSQHDAARAAFFANLLQPSLPDYEKFLGFQQEMARTGHAQVELAQQAGISKTLMSNIFAFAKLPPAITSILSTTPSALSATGAIAMLAALESGKVTDTEAAALLAARVEHRTTENDLLRKLDRPATQKAVKPAAARSAFRDGRTTKCELITTTTGLRLECRDPLDLEWLEKEVRSLLLSKYQLKP